MNGHRPDTAGHGGAPAVAVDGGGGGGGGGGAPAVPRGGGRPADAAVPRVSLRLHHCRRAGRHRGRRLGHRPGDLCPRPRGAAVGGGGADPRVSEWPLHKVLWTTAPKGKQPAPCPRDTRDPALFSFSSARAILKGSLVALPQASARRPPALALPSPRHPSSSSPAAPSALPPPPWAGAAPPPRWPCGPPGTPPPCRPAATASPAHGQERGGGTMWSGAVMEWPQAITGALALCAVPGAEEGPRRCPRAWWRRWWPPPSGGGTTTAPPATTGSTALPAAAPNPRLSPTPHPLPRGIPPPYPTSSTGGRRNQRGAAAGGGWGRSKGDIWRVNDTTRVGDSSP